MSRVRCITQDDAHVFCREKDVKAEVFKIWNIVEGFYEPFGFNLQVRLSVHDKENMSAYLGTLEEWEKVVEIFRGWFKERKIEYVEQSGEAAFYGPKIDFVAKDSLGREWQVATIQVDRNMPRRFGLTCVNEEGTEEDVVMIHAAIMGSIERFASVLIEHFVPVSDEFVAYARELSEQLQQGGVRVEVDTSKEGVGKKVRAAALEKIPWTIVIGEKEVNGGDVQVNIFGQDEDRVIKAEEFVKTVIMESEIPFVEMPEIE